MIVYKDYSVTTSEVPDEVSLTISIADCQNNCEGCHSPWLHEPTGNDLMKDIPALMKKYAENKYVTCVCLMGEGNDKRTLRRIMQYCRGKYPDIRLCLYSGADHMPDESIIALLDYVKIGSYKQELGGLASPTTNQRMYRIVHDEDLPFHEGDETANFVAQNITYKFWKEKE